MSRQTVIDDQAETVALLRQVPFLSGLHDDELATIVPFLTERRYRAGDYIIREDTRAEELFIIRTGSVKVTKNTAHGSEEIVSVRKSGAFFGEMALIEDRPRFANVIALEDTDTMVLHRDKFRELLEQPNMSLGMLRALSSRLRESDNAFIRDLQARNRRLNRLVQELRKAHEQLREQERIQQELAISKRIQTSLLPRDDPVLEGYEIRAVCRPAHEVGGDFYTYVAAADGDLGIAIGDVSGKSLPGALLMAVATSVISSVALAKTSPRQILVDANTALYEKMAAHRAFVALAYALLGVRRRRMVLANAGQVQPILCRADGSFCGFLDVCGLPLGILDLRAKSYEHAECEVELAPGDLVVFTTDGIAEAMDARHELYGLERLVQGVEACRGRSAPEVLEALLADVDHFAGGAPANDDITMVVVKVL